MKILITAIGLMACCNVPVRAQAHTAVSARSQALANIGTVLTGTWAAFHNQAGLATVDRPSFAFHLENHFLVPGWGTEAFTGCVPVKAGTLGINYAFYGFGMYHEMKTGLVYGRSFGERFRAGIELDYLCIRQPSGYGNLHAIVPGAGIQVLPNDNLMIALHFFNPAGQHYAGCGSMSIPVRIMTGVALSLGEEVLICMEMVKDQGNKAKYSMGLEYVIAETLEARIGILFDAFAQPSFGLGYLTGRLRFDLSSKCHPVAGYSLAISISILARSVSHVRTDTYSSQ